MTHFSPSVFLNWSILSITLSGFYFTHLWKFDRFRCLNLMRDRRGAFRRVMTYSYLIAIPLLLTYTVGYAIIKYREGFVTLPNGAVFPKPYELWSPNHQAVIFPLNMVWACSWGADTVSHLEELCFWFFLIHAGPLPTPWFKSKYFKIWLGGSIIGPILVLTASAVTKADPLNLGVVNYPDLPLLNEAWTQLTGSSIAFLITVGFLPILWVFPNFVKTVKAEGGDVEVVTRLVRFHDMNISRIIFRFMFVIPTLMLSIDGLKPHHHPINESLIWTDLLSMTAGIGCVIQSSITLMIFFPRNYELETNRWLQTPSTLQQRVALPKIFQPIFKQSSKDSTDSSQLEPYRLKKYLLTDSPISSKIELSTPSRTPAVQPSLSYDHPPHSNSLPWVGEHSMASLDQQEAQHQVQVYHTGNSLGLYDPNLGVVTKDASQLNPLALYYTSPIGVLDVPRVRTRQ